MQSCEDIMSSHSSIKASSSDREHTRKPVLKDAAGYGAWETKTSTILDAEECWDIVIEAELEPQSLYYSNDDDDGVDDVPSPADIATRVVEIKDWRRRFKKAASLITQLVECRILIFSDGYSLASAKSHLEHSHT